MKFYIVENCLNWRRNGWWCQILHLGWVVETVVRTCGEGRSRSFWWVYVLVIWGWHLSKHNSPPRGSFSLISPASPFVFCLYQWAMLHAPQDLSGWFLISKLTTINTHTNIHHGCCLLGHSLVHAMTYNLVTSTTNYTTLFSIFMLNLWNSHA